MNISISGGRREAAGMAFRRPACSGYCPAGRETGWDCSPVYPPDWQGQSCLMLLGAVEVSDYLDLITPKEVRKILSTRCCLFLPVKPAVCPTGSVWTSTTCSIPLLPFRQSRLLPKKSAGRLKSSSFNTRLTSPCPAIGIPTWLGSIKSRSPNQAQNAARLWWRE